MKNTPAARPNCAALSARSFVMPFGPANEIAVRSRKLMKNISATNGTRRIDTLRIADRSMGSTVTVCISHLLSVAGGRHGLPERCRPGSYLHAGEGVERQHAVAHEAQPVHWNSPALRRVERRFVER